MIRFRGVKQIEEKIKICEKCQTIVGYKENDVTEVEYESYDSRYENYKAKYKSVKCPNCGEAIFLREIEGSWRYY